MGAIVDRSQITLTQCKYYARLNVKDGSEESFLYDLLIQAIKEKADHVCNNKFILEDECGEPVLDDDEMEQPLNIPASVETWILRKFVRETQYRVAGNNEVSISDIGSIKMDSRDWDELLPNIRFE